ncbi:hypothetical protein KKH15_02365 [Patescibacteria group bacterium]|nr:hypothetical protein [Patescibacteria group bacterium]MBU1755258.1 hypothetical protein [Patescibacteria group bacterium]
MKKLIIALALLFASLGIAGTANATARWQNFGADKAYASREAALADANAVMKRAGWPEEVRRLMLQKMQQRGTTVRLTNGMHLDFMRSGSSDLWVNVLVDFKKPPSKDAGNMEYSAPAEEWVVEWGGKLWRFGRPEVCNNLYGIVVQMSQAAVLPDCPYILMEARPGDWAVNFALVGRFKPSSCFAYSYAGMNRKSIQFSSLDYMPLPTHCPTAPCDFTRTVAATGLPLMQSGSFLVEPGFYVVRVSPEFAASAKNRALFCLQRRSGWHSCGIGVQNFDYLGSLKVATIYYTKEEIPKGSTSRLWWPVPALENCHIEATPTQLV